MSRFEVGKTYIAKVSPKYDFPYTCIMRSGDYAIFRDEFLLELIMRKPRIVRGNEQCVMEEGIMLSSINNH